MLLTRLIVFVCMYYVYMKFAQIRHCMYVCMYVCTVCEH